MINANIAQASEVALPFIRILKDGQMTLPKKIRDILGLNEGGILEVEIEKTKMIFKKPKVLSNGTSTLSRQGEWKVKEATQAYNRGESKEFNNIDDLIDDLNS